MKTHGLLYIIFILSALLGASGATEASVTYTYDARGQLVTEDYGNGTFTTYTYDAAGNRLSRVFNQNASRMTVSSTNANSGAPITVSPQDNSHLSNGTTTFTRTYPNGTVVTLTAASLVNGSSFSNWTGCNSSNGTQCTVTMSSSKTVTANYGKALVVNSLNLPVGAAISVTPADKNGQSSGTTQFSRIYDPSTPVTLTAPATSGGKPFSSWTGCDNSNGTQCTVTMNGLKSVTAVYSPDLNLSSTNVPKSIPDNNPMTGATSTITVPAGTCSGGVSDVNVWIQAAHTYVGDLRVTLRSSTGMVITLIDRMFGPPGKAGCSGNNINVVLDDQASQSIFGQCNLSGTGLSGTFMPSFSLSTLNGVNPAGTWTLTVTDNALSDTGTLTGWGLTIGCSSELPNYAVTLAKTGKGTASSTPSGLSCTVSDKTCSGSFPVNSAVTLTAANGDSCPVSYAWSGACTGNVSQCEFVVAGNTNVSLEMIIINRQVRNQQTLITGTSIVGAYNSASSGHVLQAQAGVFNEDLTIIGKDLTLEGGYSCLYSSRAGLTTVKGVLTISDSASLTVDGIEVY